MPATAPGAAHAWWDISHEVIAAKAKPQSRGPRLPPPATKPRSCPFLDPLKRRVPLLGRANLLPVPPQLWKYNVLRDGQRFRFSAEGKHMDVVVSKSYILWERSGTRHQA